MKPIAATALVALVGCATSQPYVVTAAERSHFENAVRDAEAAGVADGPPEARRIFADAKSNFEYAQHLPLCPERARALATKAEKDLQTVLVLLRRAGPPRLAPTGDANRAPTSSPSIVEARASADPRALQLPKRINPSGAEQGDTR
jgi:hypothetical protein